MAYRGNIYGLAKGESRDCTSTDYHRNHFVYSNVFCVKKHSFWEVYLLHGSNPEATRLSGIKVSSVTLGIFMICGMFAAIAAVIESARLGTMQPASGNGYELLAIGSVFIGGASIYGGEGNIFASLIGALLVTTIRNGLNILGVSAFYQYVVNGLIIILQLQLIKFVENIN